MARGAYKAKGKARTKKFDRLLEPASIREIEVNAGRVSELISGKHEYSGV